MASTILPTSVEASLSGALSISPSPAILTGSGTPDSTVTSSSTSFTQAATSSVFPENCEVGGTAGCAISSEGIGLVPFLTALTSAIVIFALQVAVFLMLRNNLARIFKPKTYLVPERERTDPPPNSPWGMVGRLLRYKDREVINKCGLDAYFFLRYLQTLLIIFIPIALVVIPILVPLNYSDGIGQSLLNNTSPNARKREEPTNDGSAARQNVTGLDTLAWANVKPKNSSRYDAHLLLAILVILWVCGVFFSELRVYIKVRQDYLTTAEHRLRASATTVLVNSVPKKWLSETALTGLFDVFPGGIRNVWLTRDYTELLEKIHKRDKIHLMLEEAETELIRNAKRRQLRQRTKDEKKVRRELRQKAMTRQEQDTLHKIEDENARKLAQSGGGISSGGAEVPQDIAAAVQESRHQEEGRERYRRESRQVFSPLGTLEKIGHDLKGGLSKANEGLLRGGEHEVTTGFINMKFSRDDQPGSDASQLKKVNISAEDPGTQSMDVTRRGYHVHTSSDTSNLTHEPGFFTDSRAFGNTVRRVTNFEDMYVKETTRWYEFWKPPSGGYASPIPQGAEEEEFLLTGLRKSAEPKSLWSKMNPFARDELEPTAYPDYSTGKEPISIDQNAEWEKWVQRKDRPTHRPARFEWTPGWLPSLPFISKKVDTIYWCRKELARLNMEIELDQKNPDRYPLMNSAFIQFNHQVAAHMACQSVAHHVPKHMAPRDIEISPTDVIWDNMAITWWQEWLRTAIVLAVVIAMVVLWAFPVAWSSALSNVDSLVNSVPWLSFLRENTTVWKAVSALAGVLPALFLALALVIIPFIFDFLAGFKGCKTGAQKAETVQTYYFIFLFVQVFLVVSLASGAIETLEDLTKDVGSTISDVPNLLANNLPKAANYFFSYMILQAMSTSSGTLLQIGTLFVWYVIARMLDNTARAKWNRNTRLPRVIWGSFFPVYTNFACIALIYSVIAPIISIFAIITFSLLWLAHRYNMIYVTRFENDTGGVLYPRAINQTFTGLYVMEICLIGLFFAARDEDGNVACAAHATTMIVMLIVTCIYQYLLNRSFSSLFRYLPVTLEDEAVLRDEAFQRAQNSRFGLLGNKDDYEGIHDKYSPHQDRPPRSQNDREIELMKVESVTDGRDDGMKPFSFLAQRKLNPVRGIVHASTWAAREASRRGRNLKDMTLGRAETNFKSAAAYRQTRREQDLETQKAIGEALYGGYHDEIEDLTPDERDMLVRHAFQHYALRSRRPVVWIPRDDIGVSEDEIRRTKEFSEFVWISNEGTAMDSKVRVVYGRNPPDFSEVDLINL